MKSVYFDVCLPTFTLTNVQLTCELNSIYLFCPITLEYSIVKDSSADLGVNSETEKRETGTAGRTGMAVCRFG